MAIAFDTVSTGLANNTSVTFAHTNSGDEMIVFASINETTDKVTGATYDGVALTLIDKHVDVGENLGYIYMFHLTAPALLNHDVVISRSDSGLIEGFALTYSGAKQSGQPDSSNKGFSGGTTSFSVSTTVVAANCWLVGIARGAVTSAGAGTVLRGTPSAFPAYPADSDGVVGTGSQSLAWNGTFGSWIGIVASLAPAEDPAVISVLLGEPMVGGQIF